MMNSTLRSRFQGSRLFVLFIAFAVMLSLPTMALADNIVNNVTANAETIILNPGSTSTVSFSVEPTNSDGKNGCNLTSSKTLGVSVASSDTAVATVSPSSHTFSSCGDVKNVTVTAGKTEGTATISLTQTSNTTEGSFNLSGATFYVTVDSPNDSPNQPGTISTTSSVDNDGVFGLSWTAASPVDPNSGDTVTYTLEHKDSNDVDANGEPQWSTVASDLTSTSHSFTSESPEAEGTWDYRVKAVDNHSASSTYSTSQDLELPPIGW